MLRRSLFFVFAIIVVHGSAVDSRADITYTLSTNTTNGDSAQLISGFFTTDGTVGSNIRLGDIITNYSIAIEENGQSATLTPSNSTVSRNADFFDVTTTEVALMTGSGFFQGFEINDDSNDFIRYSALRTGADVNIIVSINSGAGGLNGIAPRAVLATSNIPEPSSLFLISIVSLAGVTIRIRQPK